MNGTIVRIAAAMIGLTAALGAPARAEVSPVAEGTLCGFSSMQDPTGDVQVGQMNGGPLVATGVGVSIALTCTIQIGEANATHAGLDAASVSSGPELQAAIVEPTVVSYLAPFDEPVYLCAEAWVGDVTYYYDSVAADWSTSADTGCFGPRSLEIDPFDPLALCLPERPKCCPPRLMPLCAVEP